MQLGLGVLREPNAIQPLKEKVAENSLISVQVSVHDSLRKKSSLCKQNSKNHSVDISLYYMMQSVFEFPILQWKQTNLRSQCLVSTAAIPCWDASVDVIVQFLKCTQKWPSSCTSSAFASALQCLQTQKHLNIDQVQLATFWKSGTSWHIVRYATEWFNVVPSYNWKTDENNVGSGLCGVE